MNSCRQMSKGLERRCFQGSPISAGGETTCLLLHVIYEMDDVSTHASGRTLGNGKAVLKHQLCASVNGLYAQIGKRSKQDHHAGGYIDRDALLESKSVQHTSSHAPPKVSPSLASQMQ